jgi:hypothetical protein
VSDPPRYVLDTNVFIQAFRGYYAFDIAPAFWRALVQQASIGRILSIDRVKHEIEQGKDELANWAVTNFQKWFASTAESDVLESYGNIMRWAQTQTQYSEAAKREFAEENNADSWLVAYADAKDCVVVTLEQLDPNVQRKIPIPNVCRAFGIDFVDTYAMLRALGVRLG